MNEKDKAALTTALASLQMINNALRRFDGYFVIDDVRGLCDKCIALGTSCLTTDSYATRNKRTEDLEADILTTLVTSIMLTREHLSLCIAIIKALSVCLEILLFAEGAYENVSTTSKTATEGN